MLLFVFLYFNGLRRLKPKTPNHGVGYTGAIVKCSTTYFTQKEVLI